MFGKWKNRRLVPHARRELSQLDTEKLRDMGLDAADFRDAFEGRRSSLLFSPFRDSSKR